MSDKVDPYYWNMHKNYMKALINYYDLPEQDRAAADKAIEEEMLLKFSDEFEDKVKKFRRDIQHNAFHRLSITHKDGRQVNQ